MLKKKNVSNSGKVDTILGENTVFEGNIRCEGTIRVEGKIDGDLNVSGDIFVGTNALITGNIFAHNVHLSGTVEGNIQSKGILRILSTAKLLGDIEVNRFVADEGAIFRGKCSMLEPADQEEQSSHKKGSQKKTRSSANYKKSGVLDSVPGNK